MPGSQSSDAYSSQENDGKKPFPLVSGTSKLFFLTLYYVLELNKSKSIIERICCFKINPESYTPNNVQCGTLILLHLIPFSHS